MRKNTLADDGVTLLKQNKNVSVAAAARLAGGPSERSVQKTFFAYRKCATLEVWKNL